MNREQATLSLVKLHADLRKVYEHVEHIKKEISRLEKVVQNSDGWTQVTRKSRPNYARVPSHPPAFSHAPHHFPTSNRFSIFNNPRSFPPLPTVPSVFQPSLPPHRPVQSRASCSLPRKNQKHSKQGKTKTLPKNTLSHSKKVLIVADSHGRNISSTMREKLPSKFSVTGIFKPSARMAQVIENLNTLTSTFDQHDTVIIIGGQNDLNHGSELNLKEHLPIILETATHTNVIMTTLPPWHNNASTNNKIQIANKHIKHHLRGSPITLIDLDSLSRNLFTKHGLHLNQVGKQKLGAMLTQQVLSSFLPSLPPTSPSLTPRTSTPPPPSPPTSTPPPSPPPTSTPPPPSPPTSKPPPPSPPTPTPPPPTFPFNSPIQLTTSVTPAPTSSSPKYNFRCNRRPPPTYDL